MTPMAAPRRCAEYGCAAYATKQSKCDDHYHPWETKSKRNSVHTQAELRAWAKQILRRDRQCMACGEKQATEADHIIPISEGGAGLSLENGQGLCHRCHWYKTRQEIRRSNRRRAGKNLDETSRQL